MSHKYIAFGVLVVVGLLCCWGIYKAVPEYGELEQSMAYGAASKAVTEEILRRNAGKTRFVVIRPLEEGSVESMLFKRFKVSGRATSSINNAEFYVPSRKFFWTAVVQKRSSGDYVLEGLLVDMEITKPEE